MPKYSILGATGATGQQILKILLQSPKNEINIYVRSFSKLLALFPNLDQNQHVKIFTGNMSDISLIASCISGTEAIFSVLASNENMPGTSIARDTANSIIAAMKQLKARDSDAKLPQIIFLSSATLNRVLNESQPKLFHWIIHNAFRHVYDDLDLAEVIFEKEKELVSVTYVTPGALIEVGEGKGWKLSLIDHSRLVTYPDLAGAMIGVVEEGGYEGRKVGIVGGEDGVRVPLTLPLSVVQGLVWTFCPWLWRGFRYLGLK